MSKGPVALDRGLPVLVPHPLDGRGVRTPRPARLRDTHVPLSTPIDVPGPSRDPGTGENRHARPAACNADARPAPARSRTGAGRAPYTTPAGRPSPLVLLTDTAYRLTNCQRTCAAIILSGHVYATTVRVTHVMPPPRRRCPARAARTRTPGSGPGTPGRDGEATPPTGRPPGPPAPPGRPTPHPSRGHARTGVHGATGRHRTPPHTSRAGALAAS